MIRQVVTRIACVTMAGIAFPLFAGMFDNAWIKGTTDKNPLSYKAGEEMVFSLELQGVDGEIPEGEYNLWWKRSDDFGAIEEGLIPLTKKPFVYRTKLEKPGFVRLEAYVVDKGGSRVKKKFTGDTRTPEGQKAMNEFERKKKTVFFDGGAGVEIESLSLAQGAEPADFDAFWTRQFARLDKVPVKVLEKVEVPQKNKNAKLYAVSIACVEGVRPVTGYLSVPNGVESGKAYPVRLSTHGYGANPSFHNPGEWAQDNEISLNINAHGMKLPAFGATDAELAALKDSIMSNGYTYAFDPEQNKDPETAYFNGMVLRVKRALQYLKTIKGWNGKDVYASGGSQGGLQTIWAAACGEGVTRADSRITWCCDMYMNNARLDKKASSDGWYIRWVPGVAYYDAVVWAKRIPMSCRTNITRAGLGDYCCPPMGLAKLWNSIPGNKSITWVQGSEHGYVPPEYKGRDFTEEK